MIYYRSEAVILLNIRGAKTSCFSGKQSFEERKRILKGEETRHVKTQGIIYLLKTSTTVIVYYRNVGCMVGKWGKST